MYSFVCVLQVTCRPNISICIIQLGSVYDLSDCEIGYIWYISSFPSNCFKIYVNYIRLQAIKRLSRIKKLVNFDKLQVGFFC